MQKTRGPAFACTLEAGNILLAHVYLMGEQGRAMVNLSF